MRRVILAGLAPLMALCVALQPAAARTVHRLAGPAIPAAVFTDPPADKAHPPRMEVLHIPSGGVEINGVAYLAGGAGPHPTLVLLHGLPGNEKNLDLAQAVRRAGWNVVTFFNYRGTWGEVEDLQLQGQPGGREGGVGACCATPPTPRPCRSTRRSWCWLGTPWAAG